MSDPLHIYCTEYERGAVIKLCQDHRSKAVAKYIVKKHPGRYELLNGNGNRPLRVNDFATLQQATDAAIRECERIRDYRSVGGADVGTG